MGIVGQSMRPWTDNGHLSPDHIEELGQLVQTCPAQHSPQGGDAPIVTTGMGDAVTVLHHSHGTEFEDGEHSTVETGATLPEQDRSIRRQPNKYSDCAQKG